MNIVYEHYRIAYGRALKNMEWKQARKARPTAFQQMAKGEWR
jgi:hypothetical protein